MGLECNKYEERIKSVRALWCLHNFLNFGTKVYMEYVNLFMVVGAAVARLSKSSLCFC